MCLGCRRRYPLHRPSNRRQGLRREESQVDNYQIVPLMKKLYTLLVAVLLLPYLASGQSVEKVNLYGYLGKRIDDCIEHRVMGQDVDYLVEPFRHRNEFKRWQSEFWGKWTLGAIETYRYTQDPALYKKIEQGVADLSKAGQLGIFQAYNVIKRFMYSGNRGTVANEN